MDLRRFVSALDKVEGLISESQEDQWQMPPNPVQSVGGRSSKVPDPTFNITADERRRALRQAVLDAEHTIALASQALEHHSRMLEDAIDRWQGNI